MQNNKSVNKIIAGIMEGFGVYNEKATIQQICDVITFISNSCHRCVHVRHFWGRNYVLLPP